MATPRKKQAGGFGINPSALALFNNLDLNNLDFNSIAQLGSQLGGQPFDQAVAQDDPSIYMNSILANGMNQANQVGPNPVLSSNQVWQQANETAKKKSFLGIGKKRQRENAERILNQQNTNNVALNQTANQSTFDNIQGVTGLFDLFNAIGQFKSGGKAKKCEDGGKCEHPEYKDGGKSEMGYSDKSPYKNEKGIVIDSNVISMDETGKHILALPDVGHPKVMTPYSGTHVFPGAKKVLEIPIKMKKGGKKKMKYYQDGGKEDIPKAVQLEDGEMITTPQLDILDTAALTTHDKLAKDIVTDVIRPEDYVFSHRNKITRKEADNISFGLGAMLYEEGKVPDMPEEQLASKLFKEGEDEMPISEYVKRIREKMPVTDKEDVFSKKTNDANKAARLPYLSAAVYINEKKRLKGKGTIETLKPEFVNKFEDSLGAMSGVDQSGARSATALPGEIPEGQAGGFLSLIPAGIQTLTGLYDAFIGNPKRKKIAVNALNADTLAANRLAATQSGYAGAASLANIAGVVGQDPTVTAPQYDPTQLDARIRRVPRSLFDYAAGRIASTSIPAQSALFNNAGSFSQAANAYAPIHSANVGAIANLGLNEANQNIGLENQYRDLRQGFNDRQTLADVTAQNATRTNANILTGNLANNISSGVTAQGAIESDRQNVGRQNELQKAQAKINANSQGVQSGYNLGLSSYNLINALPQQNTPINNNANFAQTGARIAGSAGNGIDEYGLPVSQRPPAYLPPMGNGYQDYNSYLQPPFGSTPGFYGGVSPAEGSGFFYDPVTGIRYPRF